MLRLDESAYWDSVASNKNGLVDNVWKRCAIVSRVLSHRPIYAKILEIGAGQGVAAAVTNLVSLGLIRYTGTDVSEKYCEYIRNQWKLNMEHTDVRTLPDGPFDMIWCFDSLEHVRPDDRKAGNAEINRVLGEHGVILINAPWNNDSQHSDEFDWTYDESDILALAKVCGAEVSKWDHYHIEEIDRDYLWIELVR